MMKLKKSLTAALAAASALALSACFQHETTINLKKDGSGTITEETRMSGQMLAMMAQFAAGFGGEEGEAQDPLKDLLSEDKAKERAAELGEGVTFEKIEPVTVGTSKGARATYRFADINKLRLSTNDAMTKMAAPGGLPDEAKPAAADENPITFSYKAGTLTIRTNVDTNDEKAVAEKAAEDEELDMEAMAMMKQMFADMKMSMKLVVEPGIAETNATHRDGDTIILMEMDMNKLMENPGNMKKFGAIDGEDPAAAMEALKGIDGVKAEMKPEVTVKLK